MKSISNPFHFASIHMNTSKELTEHQSEIFNPNEIWVNGLPVCVYASHMTVILIYKYNFTFLLFCVTYKLTMIKK